MKLFSVIGLDVKVVEDNTSSIFREWMKSKVKQTKVAKIKEIWRL